LIETIEQKQKHRFYNLMPSHSSHETPSIHGFVIMGTENLYFCHLPMYYMANHRYQVIFEGELTESDKNLYLKARDEIKANETPNNVIIIGNPINQKKLLRELLYSKEGSLGSFIGEAFVGLPDESSEPFMKDVEVRIKNILLFEPMEPKEKKDNKDNNYPEYVTYYLYGKDPEYHISHLLSKAPNFQQEMEIKLDKKINIDSKPIKVSIPSLKEREKQPITTDPLVEQSKYVIKYDESTSKMEVSKYQWFETSMLNTETH